MSFYETPVRRLCIIRACGLFVLALALGAFSFAPDVDEQGKLFCYGLAGLCLLLGLFNLWRARRASPQATVTTIPDRASVSSQIRYYRRMWWVAFIGFPMLTASDAHDLNQLESGAVSNVRLMEPVTAIYENFGYWPAVLSVPIAGLICCAVFTYKISRLKAAPQEESLDSSRPELI